MSQDNLNLVSAEKINSFIYNALVKAGLTSDNAASVAELMTESDVIGGDAHGIFRLPSYVKRIIAGGINPTPNITISKERDAMALIDGDNGMGHLVMKKAAEIAIEKAKKNGVAWVGANSSNHAGPASIYAKIPLKHNMIGIYVAVGSANHVPPWGGTEMLLSTNPIAIAIPSKAMPPIILDMATTVAAYGKVKEKLQRGEEMPEGWMIDKEGKPLTDPSKSGEGFLLPIGGPKGYGLALMLGILAGTLNGAAFGKNVVDFNADVTSFTNTGQFIIAIDIEAFSDVDVFKGNIDTVWKQMKASPLLPGFDEIRLPGERSDKVAKERRANGIPMHENLKAALDGVADNLGIDRIL